MTLKQIKECVVACLKNEQRSYLKTILFVLVLGVFCIGFLRDVRVTASRKGTQAPNESNVVICYYTIPNDTNSLSYLNPLDIDPSLCSHIIVGFASIENCTVNLGETPWILEKVVSLKKTEPALKVMLSIGGGNNVSGFPEMVVTHDKRKKFIRSVLNVTKTYKLDGLDLDWEFPAWSGRSKRERIYFVQLCQELRKEFDRSGQNLILSAAVGAPQGIIDQSYNVPQIAEHIDFVNLMSYDYHFYVPYYPVTDFNAPLYPGISDKGYLSWLNLNYSANYWVEKGMPKEKIIIGIPTYAHTYKLDNSFNHGVHAPVAGVGALGSGGFASYPEVCQFLADGATRVFQNDRLVPYAYKDLEWVSYDDEASVTFKVEWMKLQGFKGIMIFSLNQDDWSNTCNRGKFPLVKKVDEILNM